ncbi:MAG: 4'-phosphopantetheinyl transferase superfamily protein [Bacteroidales bacterium]|nr:4'-phosphopantetheinyl transferase superfamily protein [Bacteroidales bacterium]
MTSLSIHDVEIHIQPIPPHEEARPASHGAAHSRREIEIEARNSLIKEAFGHDAQLLHDEHGSPSIQGFPGYISISHSRQAVALAIAHHPIGIDIEEARNEQLERVRERFATPADSPTLSLLQQWTAKEAVFKAAGTPGLPLTDITVTPTSATTPDGRVYTLSWHQIGSNLLCLAL